MMTGCKCNGVGVLTGIEDDLIPLAHTINSATSDLAMRVRAFDAEMQTAPSQLQSSWNIFVAEFDTWKDAWWFNSWRRRNELLSMRRRFNELLNSYQASGGSTTLTKYTKKQATGEGPQKPGITETAERLGKYALILGLVIGGGYALGKVTGAVREVRR